jgi:hypothetical protein
MTATAAQAAAAIKALRAALDATAYGSWVSDDQLKPFGQQIADAVVRAGPHLAQKEAHHE